MLKLELELYEKGVGVFTAEVDGVLENGEIINLGW